MEAESNVHAKIAFFFFLNWYVSVAAFLLSFSLFAGDLQKLELGFVKMILNRGQSVSQ